MLAYRVGLATAYNLTEATGRRPLVVVGKDTRISSDMIEAALSAGLCAGGAHVVQLGVVPTPAVAYLTVSNHADTGIVISASHNPYYYNGIKMFSSQGFKLNDALEDAIERMVLARGAIPAKTGADLGQIYNGHHALEGYTYHLLSTVNTEISDLRVVIDCANGAASKTARTDLQPVQHRRDLHQRSAQRRQHQRALRAPPIWRGWPSGWSAAVTIWALPLTGDADRCLVVDEKGHTVDGDQIMAICASKLKEQGKLKNDGMVATIMSQPGPAQVCPVSRASVCCAAAWATGMCWK